MDTKTKKYYQSALKKERLVLYTDNAKNIRPGVELGYATDGSVGIDVRAEDFEIDFSNDTVTYYTKLSAIIPDNKNVKYSIAVRNRSSVKKKRNLVPLYGTVDADYTGEILVVFRLVYRSPFERLLARLGLKKLDIYDKGDYVAQLVVERVERPRIMEVDRKILFDITLMHFNNKPRLNNGFGSSDKNTSK